VLGNEKENTANRRPTPRSEMGRRIWLVGAFLLAGYGGFLLRYTCFSVGGSDSSGYLNTARRLVSGTLVSRPRTLDRFALPDTFVESFIPLGFVSGPRPGTMAPYYPSGIPAHLAVAAMLSGWERGPFLVSPLAALGSVLLLYLLARELSLPRAWAGAAAVVFAAWPVLIYQAIQPTSDAVATFWALAAVLCAVRARRRLLWAAASGAAVGIAVLVRPTSALLVLPLAFALPLSIKAISLFLGGGIPFAASLAAPTTFAATAMSCNPAMGRPGFGQPSRYTTSLPDFAITAAGFSVRSRPWFRWHGSGSSSIASRPGVTGRCSSRGSALFSSSIASTSLTALLRSFAFCCRPRPGSSSAPSSRSATWRRGSPGLS